jgi:peptide methionine sulfoxide reductase MsrA
MKIPFVDTAILFLLAAPYYSNAKYVTDSRFDGEEGKHFRHPGFRTVMTKENVEHTSPRAKEVSGVEMYFGAGSYWYIQHEFVQAERRILHRSDTRITSKTGYAGGTGQGSEGRVCYHNFDNIADYVKLGHAEVVGIVIPDHAIQNFTEVYLQVFDPETGERAGFQDRGPEFRSMIGLPDGSQHPFFGVVNKTCSMQGFRFEIGKGDDPDSYGKDKLVYIYDSHKFPFYQAEVSMQFRDDLQSSYGKDYNKLVEFALDDGRIVGQGCPDIF